MILGPIIGVAVGTTVIYGQLVRVGALFGLLFGALSGAFFGILYISGLAVSVLMRASQRKSFTHPISRESKQKSKYFNLAPTE